MEIFIQRGENSKYPISIETWTWGEEVPEWLSDQAKISAIDSETNKVSLEIRNTNSGGYEIIASSGQTTLLTTKHKDDYVCLDLAKGGLFVLTKDQLNLLYYGTDV